MARQNYNKLVRDLIPEIIRKNGQECEIKIMDTKEYQVALEQKLKEEVQELLDAGDAEQIMLEIADVYEVLDALILFHKLDKEAILALQEQRRQDRGGFSQRLKLLWSDG